ncbi:unnamed protein product [Heligmosomoides polygyrus]|uniref:Thiolase_N domain-containing protein n=1 Tax=Heligmosomoides polygyrus TaxID=6339 RepID=A0A183FXM3_HELPZ|nr:unnamed protein product [Heligmosomoides polygyrus]
MSQANQDFFPFAEAGGMNGINGATAIYEAALIAGKLDDVPYSSIDNSLCRTALLPNRNRRTLVPTLRTFFSATT